MSKIKMVGIVMVSVLFGAGIILAGFWFLSGKLFSAWTDKIVKVSQQNTVQNNTVQPVADCSLPTSAEMAMSDKYEAVRQASLECAAFEEEKLRYDFNPKSALTWDNAFPSREDWSRRLRIFKLALEGDWSTYRNEKYNFEFDFPKDWDIFVSVAGNKIILTKLGTHIVRPVIIDIKYGVGSLNNAINERMQGEAAGMVVTNDGLVGNEGVIQDSARTPDQYGKFVTLNNDYSSFEYHSFYRHGEFFINNNLIKITQPLSIEVPDVAGWTKEKEDLLSKINSGFANDLVKLEIKLIDRIAASFRGSVTEDRK